MLYLFVFLCCLGITDVIYIIIKNRPTQQLVCPLHSDCHAVLESQWNKFLGVKNEYWGLLYYLSLLLVVWLSIFFLSLAGNLKLILLLLTGFGVIYSGYLTVIQIVKIKEYCFYCLMSAGISVFLFVTALFFN